MERCDADTAECAIFTFKEGLLSAVAHDLKLRVAKFEIEFDDQPLRVRAQFDASSLRVEGAVRSGELDRAALSPSDRAKVERTVVEEVLHAHKHPQVRFESSDVVAQGDGYRVRGTLTLHGVAREVTAQVRRDGSRLRTELTIQQPDFGIKPYRAALGGLKVRPDVRVELSLPVPGPVVSG